MLGLVVAAALSVSPAEAAAELLRREACANHLEPFCAHMHPSWTPGEHIDVMCHYLEKLERAEIRRLAIFAPPGHAKTETVGRQFPAWFKGRNPRAQVIYATHSGDVAEDVGANVRDAIDSDEYRQIFPHIRLRDDARAQRRFIVDNIDDPRNGGGIQISVGVGKRIPGRRANLAILDDLHGGRKLADSATDRATVHAWYAGDVIQRLMRPALLLFMFTRWHEDDLAGRVLPSEDTWQRLDERGWVWKAGKWTVLRFRAIQNEGTDHETALWPGDETTAADNEIRSGFPLPYLQNMREELVSQGRARDWNAQYQQNPRTEEGTHFKREWFKRRWRVTPTPIRKYITWDGALTEKDLEASREPDRTEIGLVGLPADGAAHILDWWSGQELMAVWVDVIVDMIEKHNPAAVIGAGGTIKKAAQGFIRKELQNRNKWTQLVWLPELKDKLARAQAFQSMASMGDIVLPDEVHNPDHAWVSQWVDEIVACGAGGRWWDKLDAIGNFCRCINEFPAAVTRPEPSPSGRPGDYGVRAEAPTSWRLG